MDIAKYLISGFCSEADLQEFLLLLEFAQHGKVICGWEDLDRDDPRYDPDDYNEPYPVYDETDRAAHPRYPLAEALSWSGCYDQFIDESASPPSLRVHLPGPQGELLGPAAARAGLSVERCERCPACG